MAAAFANQEGDVICSLCLQLNKDCKVLMCGHTFCVSCLQNHISSSSSINSFLCPLCKNIINIPDTTQPKSSWADQFATNFTLKKIISDDVHPQFKTLQSICQSLKSCNLILTQNMESEIERIQRDLNLIVNKSAQKVDRMMEELTQSIQAERMELEAQIKESKRNVVKEIPDSFMKHRQLISAGEKMIKFGEYLLVHSSADEIQKNISKFIKQQQETSDFQSQSKQREIQVVRIQKANIKIQTQGLKLQLIKIHTDRKIDRQTDILKLTKTVKTELEQPHFILVLERENQTVIILNDFIKRSVKCFAVEESKFLSEYKVESGPYGLCESHHSEVVVTLPDKYQIFYLQLEGESLHLRKTLNTEKRYEFISVLPGNRLAVCTEGLRGNYLDILDEGGHIIQSFSDLKSRALTLQGHALIVLSVDTVTCMTSSGDVTWRSRDKGRLHYLTDVKCDTDKFVYVCDSNRNCIVQLSPDGQIVRDIITDQDGVSEPWFLCFHKNKVYIAELDGQIKIFTWIKV